MRDPGTNRKQGGASASEHPELVANGMDLEMTPVVGPDLQSLARTKVHVATPLSIRGGEPIAPRSSPSFASYQITETLASGGMGSVHAAVQRGAEGFLRVVALKRIHPHLMQNRNFCEMFIDEARIASRINHGNVCRVYDFGESPEGYFIAMEYLVGEPLSRVLRALQEQPVFTESPRYPLVIARIIAGIAEGLYAAHTLTDDRGELMDVVHRDISPQNLFVLYDGTVRITDFGIAHARQRVHQTRGDLLKGKLSYMAPEQLQRKRIDHRADLWALGVVLWEALTSRRLFRSDSEAETLMRVMSKPVPKPSKFNPNVSPALDAIVRRALSREPAERYSSARDMARDLERILASSGDTVPTMDLAEWMHELFPQGAQLSSRRLKIALSEPPPEPSSGSGMVVDESIPPESEDPPLSTEKPAAPAAGTNSNWVDATTMVRPRVLEPNLPTLATQQASHRRPSSGSRWVWIVNAALFVCAAGGVLFAVRARTAPPLQAQPVIASPPPPMPSQIVVTSPASAAPAPNPPTPLEEQAARPAEPRVSASARTASRAAQPSVRRESSALAPRLAVSAEAPGQSAVDASSHTGSVFLSTKGGSAEVFEGSTRLGQTPVQLVLSEGAHTLKLHPAAGGQSQVLSVDVKAGRVAFLSVELRSVPPQAP